MLIKPTSWKVSPNIYFAIVSLVFCLAEIIVIWGVVLVTDLWPMSSICIDHSWLIAKVVSWAWIVGGLGSIGFAITALVLDSRKIIAFSATIISIIVFCFCAVPNLIV